MDSSKKNIFVLGADEFNLSQMRTIDSDDKYNFHKLFSYPELEIGSGFDVDKLYKEGLEQLEKFPGSIDAIVGYWDFPTSTMLPLFRKPYDLPSPSFEAVLKCEHKYWSRVEQSQVIPQHIPQFCAVDPFADDYRQQISVDYPFWIKPVKAVLSHLGFKINNEADLDHAIEIIRENIHHLSIQFNQLLKFADMPDEIAAIDGNHCIVEAIISKGRQCTLEGYVYNGKVEVYGVIDSKREGKHHSSFSRYQYPSTVPQHIQQKMHSVTERFLKHIDFDNGPFNVEYYWDSDDDNIWLLEINTRISKSHCPLFLNVDGVTHYKVMVELALGQKPDFPHRKGKYKIAAKFMWRVYEDAKVLGVPSAQEWRSFYERFPSAEIHLQVEKGMQLSPTSAANAS
jgi:biotin carboxylase